MTLQLLRGLLLPAFPSWCLVCWVVCPAVARGEVTPQAKAPQHVISLNAEAGWELQADLNHSDGQYTVGDALELKFSSPSRDAYVHLFNICPDGKVVLLWPNEFHKQNKVARQETQSFPVPGSNVTFRTRAPVGKELLVLLATEKPLNLQDTEQSRKLMEFLDRAKAQSKSSSTLTSLRSFFVEQEQAQGWSGKAIEITTRAEEAFKSTTPPVCFRPDGREFSIHAMGDYQTTTRDGIVSHCSVVGTAEYVVSHLEVKAKSAAYTTALKEAVRNHYRKRYGDAIQTERDIAMAGGAAFEMHVKTQIEGQDWSLLIRVMQFPDQVYIVSTGDLERNFSRARADTYLNSFQRVNSTPLVSDR